jgi:hypothetical protein
LSAPRIPRLSLDLIPLDLRDHLRLICGAEPSLHLQFDQSQIPLPHDFVKRVDAAFDKAVRKGAVPGRRISSTSGQTTVPAFFPPQQRKELKYSWIPLSEIHTARSRIDSFVHLPLSERKKLHEEFAALVSCLLSQFESIGVIDDASISPEQSATLTSAFSKALAEIEEQLFHPIARKHVLESRGPVARPRVYFEGRKVRSRNKQTLSDIVGNLRRRTTQIESNQPKFVVTDRGERDSDSRTILPPQYRTTPNEDLPRPTEQLFAQLSAHIRTVMETAEEENRERRRPTIAEPPRKRPEIITTPRAHRPAPAQPQPQPARRRRSQRKEPFPSFEQIQHPENVYFDSGRYTLDPPPKGDTSDCLVYIERVFAPPPPEVIQSETTRSDDLLQIPPRDRPRSSAVASPDYLYAVSNAHLQTLLENESVLLVVDEEQARQEHAGLTELWERLGLDARTRLMMAAKLCSAVTDDTETDVHFQTILSATDRFNEYNEKYTQYKRTLKLVPGIESINADILAEVSKEFLVAESAFLRASQELRTVLGGEVNTTKGTIAEMITARTRKIHRLRASRRLDEVPR